MSSRDACDRRTVAVALVLLAVLWAAVPAVAAPIRPATHDSHILYVPLPADIKREQVAYGDRALKKRLDDLVRQQLAARARAGGEPADVVILVDHSGQKILPDLEAARSRRTAGDVAASAVSAPSELTFTFDSPSHPWTAAQLATLTTALNDFYPVAKAVYGNPAFDITVNVRRDPTIAGPGYYSAFANEIVLRDLDQLTTLCHEMIHAFRDDNISGLGIYEEGMTRAAEVEVFARLAAYVHSDEFHSYTYDVYYEGLNRSAIGAARGGMFNGYIAAFLRYQLAGYAWGKALIENPAFLSAFNQSLYARAVPDPVAASTEATLIEIAAAAQATVEGIPFLTWYGLQGILDTTPPRGYVLYQRINQYTVDLFYRDATGFEVMQAGKTITWGVYDYRDVLLDSGTAVTESNGFVYDLDPSLPAGYTGRIKVVVSANTPEGVVSDTALRMVGNETGVFGVVTTAASGTLTITPPGAGAAPIELAVSNGAFSGPSLRDVRGRFRADFTDATGRRVSRYFTKDASDYFLIVTTAPEVELPTISIAAADATATEAGTTTAAFRVTRAGSTASAVTVMYFVSGTATAGTDYTALPGSVVIPAGRTAANIVVRPLDDGAMEGNQTVIATLVPSAAYTLGDRRAAKITIISDETVSISAVDATASEAGRTTGRFRVTRTGPTASALTVRYSVTGTATAASDYATLPGSVIIPAGRSTVDITVTPVDDDLMERPETVIATLLSTSAYTIGAQRSATVTIASNERVSIAAIDATATEAGRTTAAFRVTRTGSTASSLTVVYSVTGTATPGTDYTALSGSVIIAAGRAAADIVVRPVDDAVAEADETVIATLLADARYSIGARTATVVIVSDD